MKKFILGFITAAMFFGAVGTYAATTSKIDILWNVKEIKFDGVTKKTSSKPFSYNGTPYVPLKFIGDNFNKVVSYDKATQTVSVNTPKPTKPKVAYLGDTVKYMNYQEENGSNTAILVYNNKTDLNNGYESKLPAKDNLGSVYKHFLFMKIDNYANDQSYNFVEFPLKSKYVQFTTNVGLADKYKDTKNIATVEILVDGEVIKTVELKAGDFPEEVNVNVENGKKLAVRLTRSGSNRDYTSVILGNPILK